MKALTVAGALALVAGAAISAEFALSCVRRGLRESGSLCQERLEGPMRSAFTPAASDAVGNCERLLEKGEYSGVLVDAEIALAEPGLRPNERAVLLLLRADALLAVRADVEPALRDVLRLPCSLFHKMDAIWKRAEAFKKRGDLRGTIRHLEEGMESLVPKHRSPTAGEAYSFHFTAAGISELCEEAGDTGAAYDWARRAQFDYAFDGHCGRAIQEVHGWGEERIARTAARVGGSYSPAPFDLVEWNRRRHGGPLSAGFAWGGVALAAAGLLCIRPRATAGLWTRVIWRRRRYALGCLVPALLTAGLLVPVLVMSVELPGLDALRERRGWPSPLWHLARRGDSELGFLRYWCAFPAWFFGFALLLGAFVLSGLTYLGSVLGRDPTRPPAPRTKCRAPGP